MVDILILGATGITGRQTTRYLATHPQRSQFTFAIAGRSQKKLDDLVSDLSLSKSIPVHVVDVTRFEQVEAIVKQHRIVLNTVGPYVKWGENVVRACARNGVHYTDLTGEQIFVKEMIEKYAYVASKTGSIIVPACGMDSLPSDMAVFVANKALKDYSQNTEPLQIDTSTTVYDIEGVLSNGTVSTIVAAVGSTPSHKMAASLRDHFLSPVSGKPSPSPRLVYKTTLPSTLEAVVGGYFLMSSANRAIVQRSQGLLEYEMLTRKTNKANRERYGSQMVYEEFMRQKSALMGAILTLTLLVGLGLLAIPPVRWLFGRYGMNETSAALDKQLAETGKLTVINVTTSEPSPAFPKGPVKVETTISAKGDPGYYLSPAMMAESGLALLLNRDELPALAKQGGVLTPAVALGDVIIGRLREFSGFEVVYEVVEGSNGTRESRKSV
ncbi:hypothetical protein GYMLUDRAFT_202410 [Collybiopsis luxurians FD-317 M1]|uniref:Saccharopine dehydrogenase NADP binding domain-containing protein n=1 Tax=Collybiopsis luxurians FD-317 M1 TaxID=944289 RepID=A0A0D0CSE1_9AGAR|nr:hypothetical protein GYMLUDRAFT_202410 [Collybiopsis luxurians FD-317 M1]